MIHNPHNNNYCNHLLLVLLSASSFANATEYRHLQWLDLQTEADQIAMQHLPPIDHSKPQNYNNDPFAGVSDFDSATIAKNLAQQQATAVLHSATVRPELNGVSVQMEGYIVPLETNKRGAVVEFFLVPYIGACIHVPPPPPNQVVYVRYEKGINANLINDAIHVEGKLRRAAMSKPLAQAAYSMTVDRAYEYKENR